MKKTAIYIIILVTTITLNARWATITLQDHIKRSSLIVVAQFEKEIEKKSTDVGEVQLVSFRPIESIKGETNSSFVVEGTALYMCIAQMIFPVTPEAKYLLFLTKGDDGNYHLTHGERSGLLIENDKLNWVKDRTKIDWGSEEMSIDKVKEEIESLL